MKLNHKYTILLIKIFLFWLQRHLITLEGAHAHGEDFTYKERHNNPDSISVNTFHFLKLNRYFYWLKNYTNSIILKINCMSTIYLFIYFGEGEGGGGGWFTKLFTDKGEEFRHGKYGYQVILITHSPHVCITLQFHYS